MFMCIIWTILKSEVKAYYFNWFLINFPCFDYVLICYLFQLNATSVMNFRAFWFKHNINVDYLYIVFYYYKVGLRIHCLMKDSSDNIIKRWEKIIA